MKSFLKYTLATIVGVIVVNIILLFVFFGFLGALATMGDKPVIIKNNSILKIDLDQIIQDRASTNPLDNFNLATLKSTPSLGLNKILESIKKAAKDDRIKGIYMPLSNISANFGGSGTILEIRNALAEFKKSGKFIYTYTNLGYSQGAYYLATIADSIFVNPETPLMLQGLGGTVYFYKNTLDKIGIKPEIIKVGKYKSAIEMFTRTEMSNEDRQQTEAYLNSLWGTMLEGISESRAIPVDSLNWLADHLQYRTTQQEKEFGLYDGICYEDEMLQILKTKCGLKADDKLNFASLSDYQKVSLPKKEVYTGKDKIAVIYATGEINMEQSNSTIGPELAQIIRKIREDKNVKAIVMRVNSPGGSALTSDIIWHEVQLASQAKPFIVSMGNVAASGGYYISCAADTILADPTTLTGSIGIFGLLFSGEKLYNDKLGITQSVVKTNEHSDFGNSYPLPVPISTRPLSAYEKNVYQNFIEAGYETFLNRVAQGRHMTRDEVHEVAQGRVWTGKDALKVGLVDMLGGLEDAIAIAANKAGLEKYKIAEYPVEKNPLAEIFGDFSGNLRARILQKELGENYALYNNIKTLTQTQQGILARMPYDLQIE